MPRIVDVTVSRKLGSTAAAKWFGDGKGRTLPRVVDVTISRKPSPCCTTH